MNDQVEFSDEQNEESEHRLDRSALAETVMYVTDWTCDTIISQLLKKNIVLTPRFQRRDAWPIPRKSLFIESILLGIPIPQVVLAESNDERGRFLVLDGKQRLITLLQFVGKADESPNNSFRLKGLEVLSELNGSTYEDLLTNPSTQDLVRQFSNYSIRSSIVRNWKDPALLDTIFVRLNSNSVQLSPQELRQALFPGPFSDFIDEQSATSAGIRRILGTDKPDFRMRDAELLLRFLAFNINLDNYSGNMRGFLNKFTIEMNSDWKYISAQLKMDLDRIEQAIKFGIDVFGNNFGKKSNGRSFERLMNRAVLDVQIYFFSHPGVLNALHGKTQDIVDAFHVLSKEVAFARAVETTTKSVEAVFMRFDLWSKALRALGAPALQVELVNKSIRVF